MRHLAMKGSVSNGFPGGFPVEPERRSAQPHLTALAAARTEIGARPSPKQHMGVSPHGGGRFFWKCSTDQFGADQFRA